MCRVPPGPVSSNAMIQYAVFACVAMTTLTGAHATVVSLPGVPVAMMTPDENVLPVVSTTNGRFVCAPVNLYQTLLFVTGAPQVALAIASVESVVARVVSTVCEYGNVDMTMACA